MTYQTKKLGDVCVVVKKVKPVDIYSGSFIYVDISSVDPIQKQIIKPKQILAVDAPGRARKLLKTGDSIFATTRPYLENIAFVTNDFNGAIASTGFCVISPDKKKCDYKYIFYLISSKSFIDKVLVKQKGTSYPAVSDQNIYDIEIPLPPLAEQKKIVAKIEKLMAKIDEAKKLRAQALADTKNLLPSALHKIFSKGKKKYKLEELGNVTKLVRGPFGGSLKKEIFVDSGDCVYEQGNVIGNNLENFRYFITPEKFEEMKRFEVSAGDILMSCSGTIGKFVIIPKKFKKGIINQALLKITPNQKTTADYLKYALQDYLSLSNTHVKGMAIKNIAAVKELKKLKIPLPPLAEQKKIVKYLDSLSQKARHLQTLQTETAQDLATLQTSILHKAFNGELL